MNNRESTPPTDVDHFDLIVLQSIMVSRKFRYFFFLVKFHWVFFFRNAFNVLSILKWNNTMAKSMQRKNELLDTNTNSISHNQWEIVCFLTHFHHLTTIFLCGYTMFCARSEYKYFMAFVHRLFIYQMMLCNQICIFYRNSRLNYANVKKNSSKKSQLTKKLWKKKQLKTNVWMNVKKSLTKKKNKLSILWKNTKKRGRTQQRYEQLLKRIMIIMWTPSHHSHIKIGWTTSKKKK